MPFIATAIGTKVAIAAIALAALGGGTAAAAAAAGVLPAPGHPFVDQTPGTPEPTASESDSPESPSPSTSASPVGPDATGPAAFGLCTAYTAGGLSTHSIAYGALLAASSDGDISAYCATVLSTAPGHSGDHGHSDPVPQHAGGHDQGKGGKSDDASGSHHGH